MSQNLASAKRDKILKKNSSSKVLDAEFAPGSNVAKPFSEQDYKIIIDIITDATSLAQNDENISLQNILQSYERVLESNGLKPLEDTYYYRFLLKLSLDPDPDWWSKLAHEARLQEMQLSSLVEQQSRNIAMESVGSGAGSSERSRRRSSSKPGSVASVASGSVKSRRSASGTKRRAGSVSIPPPTLTMDPTAHKAIVSAVQKARPGVLNSSETNPAAASSSLLHAMASSRRKKSSTSTSSSAEEGGFGS
eukprot:CAMPEP_0175081538 /NCGR_PEP_ID=MMETSP0052_2-20121109/26209_1 /TAXON_ID=51329 ORGANISM="Polytomella parva, Strain SAG 63-3" /NCGR_SAMPLE_ID=MMETSP0052_2 /ASSEMBLY_ACC=CAM_ASM_000194 /LENGTH=249 /DNA_ID=CAMNT_0016352541 /DNA_START=112 /DNA_END=861 /DNA_ORIENTATION=+